MAYMGMAYAFSGRMAEAEESSLRAIELWKSLGAVQFTVFWDIMRSWVDLGANRPQDATRRMLRTRESLKKLASRDQSRFRMHCWLVLTERDLALGRTDSARIRLAVMSDSLGTLGGWTRQVMEYETGVSTGNILLAEGKADSALMCFGALTSPRNPQLYSPDLAYFNLPALSPHRYDGAARAYLMKGDTSSAIRELEQLVRAYPQRSEFRFVNPLLHYSLGLLLDRNGQGKKAAQQYEKFIAMYSKADGNPPELRVARQRLQELSKAN
jgi:tetratricopeptide (TPR) repeat protein